MIYMKNYKNLFFIVVIQILLVGCGFSTYNVNSLPPQLRQLYYQAEHPNEAFEINLKKKLKAAGVNILSEPTKSSPIININFSYSSGVNSPISSTQARIYNLNYAATITISDFYNKNLLAPQIAAVTRNVTLQPNEVFEATSQIAMIKREMQQELAIKIFNILSAKKTFQALKNMSLSKKT
jgi:outer membrane lipopolysaccharide assembly protein LptE/RlpB